MALTAASFRSTPEPIAASRTPFASGTQAAMYRASLASLRARRVSPEAQC
jgi:hypothetical protein